MGAQEPSESYRPFPEPSLANFPPETNLRTFRFGAETSKLKRFSDLGV